MLNSLKKKDFQFKKSKKTFILFFVLLANISFGQDLSYIYGKVVDSKTGEPLAFASIVQKNKSVGLITNDDGSFKLPSYYATANATIVVSFIGYYSEEIVVTNLDRNNLNVIKLVEKTEFLEEIVIKNKVKRNLTAKDIVKLAIKNIRNNYPFNSFSYVGYYRDYQKSKDNTYVNLNEAILHVHDPGFGFLDFASTNTQIYQYETNKNFPIDTVAARPYDYSAKTKVIDNAKLGYLSTNANEFTMLRVHDAIRNYNINSYDFVNKFKKDFVQNHVFEKIKETSFDDVALYEIGVFKFLDNVFAEGKIYISKDDYKIYKFQYTVYKRTRVKSRSSSYMNSVSMVPDKGELIINIIVEYTNYNEMMYPKYISFNNPFEVLSPPKFVPVDAKFATFPMSSGVPLIYVDMTFNNEISPKKAYRKKNYKMRYQGAKVKIDSVRVMGKTLRIWPNDNDMYFPKQAFLSGRRLSGSDFNLEVKNITDVYGNVVFEDEVVPYSQYREFFIQQLNTNPQKNPLDSLYMIKDKPLSSDQPMSPPKDISQYWMNSPLKE